MEKAPSKTNLLVVSLLGPMLLAAGVLGILKPKPDGVMSRALPYSIFHIVFGLIGTRIALSRQDGAARRFNLVLGAIDVWQAVAGVTGLFPKDLFGLKPVDHLVHALGGSFLIKLGLTRGKSSADEAA